MSKFQKKLIGQKGFTLVEIIVAIAILAFGIVLVYSAFGLTVTLTYNAAYRFTAASLAHEGLEIIKNIRDTNFLNGTAWPSTFISGPCATGCMADYKTLTPAQLTAYTGATLSLDGDGFYSYSGITPTLFSRKITISPVAGTANALLVDVAVLWNYNGKSFTVDSQEYLYNWH